MNVDRVLVLNTDMSLFGTTTWENAVCQAERGRVEVLLTSDVLIHVGRNMYKPRIIRIINAFRHVWKKAVPWSYANIHTRDKRTCQYCKTKLDSKELTIDHVIPKAQGGKNTWTNTVTACFPCNNKKGDKTPSQANMTLRKRPYQPTIMEFILIKVKHEGLDSLLEETKYFS